MYRLRKNSDFARKLLVDGKYYEQYAFPARHPNGDLYILSICGTITGGLQTQEIRGLHSPSNGNT